MKKAIIPILALFFLASCTLPFTITWNTPAAEVTVPAVQLPQETAPVVIITATPETPTQMSGYETNLGGVYMIVPPCLGTGATGLIMAANDPGPDMPPFAYNPEYRNITINGYPVTNDIWKPEVRVYPIAEYNNLLGDNSINDTVTELNQIISSHIFPTNNYPMLPIENATQVFKAQASVFNFQNGQGIGYLTEMAQYVDPANNADMFYTYQGVTNDGKYWVAAFFPVHAPFLPSAPNDTNVPAGGIAFPADPADTSAITAYYAQMTDLLNNTPLDTFNPSLACIISFIQTLNITN